MSRALVLAAALLPATAHAQSVVTVNAVQIFGTIDPAKINDYTEYMAAVNLYDALTTLDAEGTIQPQLAESWEVSDDDLTYTFTLKEGATFQDGSPVEASDVVYSVNRLLALNEGPAYLFEGVLEEGSVTAPDPRTVRFQLSRVYAPFLSNTPILFVLNEEQATAEGGDDPWAEDFVANTSIGAGAFSLASWDRGAAMTLARFEDYHQGWHDEPIDEVRFVVTTEEATVRALAASGTLSMSSDAQALETYEAIGGMEGYRIETYPTATNFYFKLNNQRPPTDDPDIRRAIALATDYDLIREVLLPGEALAGPMAPVFAEAHADDLEPVAYDLEAARAAVEASAHAGETPIQVEMMYVAGLAFEEEIALLMKSNLDQIGFDTILRPEPWNRMTELASAVETTPAMSQVFYGPTYPSPDSFFYPQYHSAASGTWSSMDWVMDDDVDAMIEEARGTTDAEARDAVYKDLQRRLAEDQVAVFVLTQTSQQAFHDCLQGFEWVPMQSFEFDFHTMRWTCD